MYRFEPSSCAPSALGPNTRAPLARSRSAIPSTSGCSGPTTTRSASSSSADVATDPSMPALPGVTTTSAVRPSTSASACSRAPPPTTTTFTGASIPAMDVLVAARARADEVHRDADLLLQERQVLLGGLRQVLLLGDRREVGVPPGQLLVDRLGLVEVRLVVRQVLVANAVDVVGDAHLDRLQRVEDIELRDRQLGQRVEADRVPQHHRVEPTGTPPAPRV